MAKFLNLRENAGSFKNDDGVEQEYHNFTFSYLDKRGKTDLTRNELSNSTNMAAFDVKIKPENLNSFFGTEVFTTEQFKDDFLSDIELVFGRDGVCGVKFVTDKTAKKA